MKIQKYYAPITKLDEELRMVWGYASTEAVDHDGEIISADAIRAAWDDYMKFANVREMHQPLAAGTVKEYSFDDKGVFIGAHIVDDVAWKKVKEKVYKGFSIGGDLTSYDPVNKTVTGITLVEISLVDRPANPEALIEIFKLAGTKEMGASKMSKQNEVAAGSQALAELLNSLGEAGIKKFTALAEAVQKGQHVTISDPEPLKIQKAIKTLVASGGLEKGMWDVGYLVSIIQDLKYLTQDTAYEAIYEQDGSSIPARLSAACAELAQILIDLVTEESAEMLADLPSTASTAVQQLEAVVGKAAGAGAEHIAKVTGVLDLLKAGKRNSAEDQQRIQDAHDIIKALGADCSNSDTIKAADIDEVAPAAKLAGTVEKMAAEQATLRKALEAATATITTLQKAFNAKPQEPKISKSVTTSKDDETALTPDNTVEPVLKLDGSIDDVATAIKKIHSSGGRSL